jgi:hypothetical protein
MPEAIKRQTTWGQAPIGVFSGSLPVDPLHDEADLVGWVSERSKNSEVATLFMSTILSRAINAFSGSLPVDPLHEEADLGAWKSVRLANATTATFPVHTIWSRAINAFTEQNTVESEADQVRKTILQFDPFQTVRHKAALTKNLLVLFNCAKEEDSNSPGIAIGSVRSFLSFMQSNPTLRIPAISLTPEYHVYITWKIAKSKLFSVRFLPNGDARFVLFRENKLHLDKIDRHYGTTTADLIMQIIEKHDIKNWICDEG